LISEEKAVMADKVTMRDVGAREALKCIRGGMSNAELMAKFKLNTQGYADLLRQLFERRLITARDLERRGIQFKVLKKKQESAPTISVPPDGEEFLDTTPLTQLLAFKPTAAPRAFSGKLDNVDILDIVQMLLLVGRKALLLVRSAQGIECQIYFAEGRIVHAKMGSLQGEDAFFACMDLGGGSFETQPWQNPNENTIHELGELLLLEAARRRDEAALDLSGGRERY
jgi:hypothetical protein